MFWLLRNYKVSRYLRKIYFIGNVLALVVFEENLGYLVFVCFSQLQQAFTFSLADKLSLVFTVILLFGAFFFVFSFYFLVFRYLGKKSCYFTEFTYRELPGVIWKIIHCLTRNFIRGAIFCFLYYQYENQLVMLCSL